MEVGATDVFEKEYTEEFRTIAARHGEFLRYERDRGARDIGLHLTRRTSDGRDILAPVTAWFQLKGIGAQTYTAEQFEAAESVPVVLETKHLRYWYLQSDPTYLVVYVASAKAFLILEMRAYIRSTWGDGIFELAQKTATVRVPVASVLDEQAFELIKFKRTAARWHELTGENEGVMAIALRDAHLISRLARLDQATREASLLVRKYLTKVRMELHFRERERPAGAWETIHQHWQQWMDLDDLANEFPYVRLVALSDEVPDDDDPWTLRVADGAICYGREYYGEAVEFECSCSLNELGLRLARWVGLMVEAGAMEIPSEATFTSQASWHHRAV